MNLVSDQLRLLMCCLHMEREDFSTVIGGQQSDAMSDLRTGFCSPNGGSMEHELSQARDPDSVVQSNSKAKHQVRKNSGALPQLFAIAAAFARVP